MHYWTFCCLLLLGALTTDPARAQGLPAERPPAETTPAGLSAPGEAAVTGQFRTLGAYRLGPGESVRVDGRLDEAVWGRAVAATGFVQREPTPGAPVSERTEAYVLYDALALYVGFRCYVSDPATLVGPRARRDEFPTSDRVSVDIDSYADGRTAFSFALTLRGTRQDLLVYDDVREDAGWDAVWEGQTARFSGPEGSGYTAEFRIPFAQLRYRRGDGLWGIQFQRDIPATGETAFWAPILPDREGYVSRFGRLTDLRGLAVPRRVELVPYLAGQLTRAPGDAADPFYDPNAVAPRVGLDAKVGVTSGLTLTATLNPDFGQVEADPAVVNLSQFEVFFEERRPFFTEGVDVFAFGATRASSVTNRPTFFYSRRIGREPAPFDRLYPDSAYAYVRVPAQTAIAGAGKVSGQVGGWSLGLLTAATAPSEAAYVTPEGARRAARVEPLGSYTVARARRAWHGGRTLAGGFGSAVLRDAGGPFAPVLPGRALVGGLDAEHAFVGRAWTLSGVLAGSAVSGDAALVTTLQRAPQRYFQRPDADYLDVDPEQTSLSGYRGEFSLARTAGRHWRGSVTAGAVSPGFDVNDLGFQTRADVRSLDARVDYVEPQPGGLVAGRLRRWSLTGIASHGWNHGGDRVQQSYRLGAAAVYPSLWSTVVTLGGSPAHANDRLTRGGPLALRPPDAVAALTVGSDARRRVRGTFVAQGRRHLPAGQDARLGWAQIVQADLAFRPSAALDLTLSPQYVRRLDTDQFLGSRADPLAGGTFGRGYLFSDVAQETVSLGTRVDWTLSPDLTVQLYAAPYLAKGLFSGYKQLREAGTFDFDVFGRDRGTVTPQAVGEDGVARPAADALRADRFLVDPGNGGAAFALPNRSFNYRSLRGNAVLRWEWRPGSTLFFVWQQLRDEFETYDGFRLGDEIGRVLDAPPHNVFLVKATYWIGR